MIKLFGQIFLMMGFGFAFTKYGVIQKGMQDNLSKFLMKVVLPINIISSAGQKFTLENAWGMAEILLIGIAYYLVSLGILSTVTKCWASNRDFRGMFINLAVFANVGFIGFPVLGKLYGDTGTLFAVAYNICYQLMFFSYGLLLIQGQGKITLKKLFGNSIIYVSIGSMLLYFSGLRFPDFIQSTISSIGSMMTPLSMILIGAEIAHIKYTEILKDRYSFIVSGLRLLVFPLVVAMILKLCGIDRTVAISAVLLTALPSGSLTVIAAQENGKNTAFAARAVAQSTILTLATLPVLSMFANFLFSG